MPSISRGEISESVLECSPERVVVKLNRAPFRRHPLWVAAAVTAGLGVLMATLAAMLKDHLTVLHAVLLWLITVVVALRNLLFDLTLIADGPQGRVWLESRNVLRVGDSRKQLCSAQDTRSVLLRSRVDLEGEPRPYELHEIHADTRSGKVMLCAFADPRTAEVVGRTLAQILDCECRGA